MSQCFSSFFFLPLFFFWGLTNDWNSFVWPIASKTVTVDCQLLSRGARNLGVSYRFLFGGGQSTNDTHTETKNKSRTSIRNRIVIELNSGNKNKALRDLIWFPPFKKQNQSHKPSNETRGRFRSHQVCLSIERKRQATKTNDRITLLLLLSNERRRHWLVVCSSATGCDWILPCALRSRLEEGLFFYFFLVCASRFPHFAMMKEKCPTASSMCLRQQVFFLCDIFAMLSKESGGERKVIDMEVRTWVKRRGTDRVQSRLPCHPLEDWLGPLKVGFGQRPFCWLNFQLSRHEKWARGFIQQKGRGCTSLFQTDRSLWCRWTFFVCFCWRRKTTIKLVVGRCDCSADAVSILLVIAFDFVATGSDRNWGTCVSLSLHSRLAFLGSDPPIAKCHGSD